MKTIVIKTQAELDALPESFSEYTVIEIRSSPDVRLQVTKARGSSHVVARESSHVEARESSHVVAWESSHVVAWGSSHVEARGSSHVVAWESSHVEAWGSSHVVAWGSSHVVAWESSHVEAWGSSHVEAWESSHVEARESSHVEAWESSHVEARGSSHVVAWGSVSVHCHSNYSTLELFGFAVAILISKAKNIKKKKTCTVVTPKKLESAKQWIESECEHDKSSVTLFKRVSKDFKTQENTENETVWTVGTTLTHANYDPSTQECGAGKFHACSRPFFCDEFRSIPGDRYIALKVARKELHFWKGGKYPHKIAFRKAEVLFECDQLGREIVKP